MEKFYEPTSYYAFHPVYSGAKHYMVFVSHYSMENGEMQICTYSEKKYSIDSCIQWAYLKLALFEKTNAFHMVVFDPSGKETASWHPDRTITAIYFVESDETVKEHTWELTPKEQEFFRKKMEAYAKTQGNQTLQEIWEETKDYIELPTTKNPNKKVYQQDTEKIEDKIDSQGYITGIVYVPLEEVINSSRDRFLELLSIGLTDTTRLRYISYEIVSAETTKSEIGFRVKGDASAIIGTVKGDGIIQDCSLVKKKLVGKKYHLTKIDHETHNYIGTVEGKKGEFSFFPEVLEYSL